MEKRVCDVCCDSEGIIKDPYRRFSRLTKKYAERSRKAERMRATGFRKKRKSALLLTILKQLSATIGAKLYKMLFHGGAYDKYSRCRGRC